MQLDILNGASSSLNVLRVWAYEICIKIYSLLTLNIHFSPPDYRVISGILYKKRKIFLNVKSNTNFLPLCY